MINRLLALLSMLAIGAACLVFGIAKASAAEAPRPFTTALVVTQPGARPEVRRLYEFKTACDMDLSGEVRLVKAGTRLECHPIGKVMR